MRNYGQHDIVVIGGGPVGAAAALELQAAGFDLLVVESRRAQALSDDRRPLALSHGSRLILERLGVWRAIEPATAIERIHISHRGRFGRTLLTREEAGLPALGYVADYAGVVAALEAALARAHPPILYGAQVSSIAHDDRTARVELETAEGPGECYARLVIVADGNAELAGVDVRVIDYGQHAVTARVGLERHHAHTAYERFTAEGPLALLPFGNDYAVVWTTTPQHAERLCSASERGFLAELEATFGERAGGFTQASARVAHALKLRVAEYATSGRAVLIGNAAQTLHPVAGQGFNLGLRDAWELAGELRRRGLDAENLLAAYRARRRIDRSGGVAFTHALVTLFSNDWTPLAAARAVGLAALDCVPPAKDFVVRRMVFGARG